MVQEEAGALPVSLSVRRDNPARALYQRLGFVPRETNVYRFSHD